MTNEPEKIRITSEDLAELRLEQPLSPASGSTVEPGGTRKYGNIRDTASPELAGGTPRGSILLKGWFYLGLSGLLGALAGWALIEPFFLDGPEETPTSWLESLMIPAVVAMLCFGCGIAESVVERSWKRALSRGGIALGLGIPLGFIFSFVASAFYNVFLSIAASGGGLTPESPSWWVCRALAWVVFGVSAGLVYGVVGLSARKLVYGILGGMLGGGIGGFLFDPIANQMDSGELSRALGFGLFGLATGVAIGLVESALKDRWLYVTAGPLAGKQFILYKPVTTIGRNQGCDLYLFKDPSIQEMHASIEQRGGRFWLRADGPVYVQGQTVKQHMLANRDLLQVGRYTFLYQERQRQ